MLETLRRDQHVKPEDYERQKAALENPGDVSIAKVYVMLALTVAAVVTVLFFVALR